MPRAFQDKAVAAVFDQYSEPTRAALLVLRDLVFQTAAETDGVGKVLETLKWGQPSYLTSKPKSGTTIRLGENATEDGDYAMFVHCQTNLVSQWREHYPELHYSSTRALNLNSRAKLPVDAVKHCIALALTYHKRKTVDA